RVVRPMTVVHPAATEPPPFVITSSQVTGGSRSTLRECPRSPGGPVHPPFTWTARSVHRPYLPFAASGPESRRARCTGTHVRRNTGENPAARLPCPTRRDRRRRRQRTAARGLCPGQRVRPSRRRGRRRGGRERGLRQHRRGRRLL